jgi:hypothetical protein
MGPWRARSSSSAGAVAAFAAPAVAKAAADADAAQDAASWLAARNEPAPLEQCDERWRDARLDHFSWAPEVAGKTFKQRYYICARV